MEEFTKLAELENARIVIEHALHRWQSMVVLEQEAPFYCTMPLPIVLKHETSSLCTLADCLAQIAAFSTEHETTSYRGENAEALLNESKRLATVALCNAVNMNDNFGEGKAHAVMGKIATSRNSLVMARNFFSLSLKALSLVVKRDHDWGMLRFEVNNKMKRIDKKLARRKSMISSLKMRHTEVGEEEETLRKLFENRAQGNSTLGKQALGDILTESGSYPPLKSEELDDLIFQICGTRDSETTEISFDDFWYWWMKSEKQQLKASSEHRNHISLDEPKEPTQPAAEPTWEEKLQLVRLESMGQPKSPSKSPTKTKKPRRAKTKKKGDGLKVKLGGK